MLLEETQRMSKDSDSEHMLAIGSLNLNTSVQSLDRVTRGSTIKVHIKYSKNGRVIS